MKSFFITFRSVTYAQRAERVCIRAGLRCSMRRTPRWMEERGCGYGVEVRAAQLEVPLELLRQEGVQHRKCYLLRENGIVEEITNGLS